MDGLRDFIRTQMIPRAEHLHYEIELAKYHAQAGKTHGDKTVPSGFKAVLFLWEKALSLVSSVWGMIANRAKENDDSSGPGQGEEEAELVLEEPEMPVLLTVDYAELKKRCVF